MSNKFIDNLIMKNDNVSELKNNKNYVKESDLPDLVARIVTAEFIEAQNAKFSQAQIDQLAAGDIRVSGTIYAQAGRIGGAKIKDELLEVKNANIAENLNANHINVQSIVAVDAFIQALTASNAFIQSLVASNAFIQTLTASTAFIDNLIAKRVQCVTPFTDETLGVNIPCETNITGYSMVTKCPIWQEVTTTPGETTRYFIITSRFYANNMEFVRGFFCTRIYEDSNSLCYMLDENNNGDTTRLSTFTCNLQYLKSKFYPYSWNSIIIPSGR